MKTKPVWWLESKKRTASKRRRKRAKDERSEGQVYYLYAISNGDFVKLGMSRDPDKRMRSLQVSSPIKLKLIKTWPVADTSHGAKIAENDAHEFFRSEHVRGEWFHSRIVNVFDRFVPKSNGKVKFNRPEGDGRVWFGSYRGREWNHVPTHYLEWVVDRFDENHRAYKICKALLEQKAKS